VHRYVTQARGGLATDALAGFRRFPSWLWRNTVVLSFIGWLAAENASRPPEAPRGGFYGLDLYSLYSSIEALLPYLDRVDPEAAARARAPYACFDHLREEAGLSGQSAGVGLTESCEHAVTQQLAELRAHTLDTMWTEADADERFDAEQNALIVKN